MKPLADDAWAWAHVDDEADAEIRSVDTGSVLAVLVVHNAEDWLERTLASLAALDDRPGQLCAVNAGSTDGSLKILAEAFEAGTIDTLITVDEPTGFGNAVKAGISEVVSEDTTFDWLWLLHDDLEPDRAALKELVWAGETGVDVVVPAQLLPKLRNRPDRVLEIGQSIADSGRRVESPGQSVESGDPDQNQEDPTDVLGASTAGLLISWSVWEALDGLDPALPLFRDGLDFGWRAHQAGYQVRTCPEARVYHYQLGRWADRELALTQDPDALDRQLAMRVLTAHSDNPRRTKSRLIWGSIVGALGFLIGKDPSRAKSYLRAAKDFRKDDKVVNEMRERAVPDPKPVKTELRPTRKQAVKAILERAAVAVSDTIRDWTGYDSSSDINLDDLTADDYVNRGTKKIQFSPILLSGVFIGLLCVISGWHLFGSGSLTGPGLLPAPTTLGEAWRTWTTQTPGVPGAPAPWLGWATIGTFITFWQPEWFASLLILFGPLLAWLTATIFFRKIVEPPWLAALLASCWGLSMPLLGISGTGLLGAMATGIVLPLLARNIKHWFDDDNNFLDPVRAPGAIALWTGILAGIYPLVWLAVVALAGLAIIHNRDRIVGAMIVLAGPVILNIGWLPYLFFEPARIVTGLDPTTIAASDAVLPWQVLIGRANVVQAPLWISVFTIGMLWVLALFASTLPFASAKIRSTLIGTAVILVAGAMALSQKVVGLAQVAVRPATDPWLLATILVLLSIVGLGLDFALQNPETIHRTWQISLSGLLVGVLLVGLGWWLGGAMQSLARSRDPHPQYVRAVMESGRNSRVLMVEVDEEEATWSIADAKKPSWGSGEYDPVLQDVSASGQASLLARQIAQGNLSASFAEDLASLGISHIWLRTTSADLVASVNNAQDLSGAAVGQDTYVWTVSTLTSRYWVKTGDELIQIVDYQIPETTPDSTLVVADAKDQRASAKLDGNPLAKVESDNWYQEYQLDGTAGELTLAMKSSWPVAVFELLVVVILGIMGAPSVRRTNVARRAL